jgi:hypothetical protein
MATAETTRIVNATKLVVNKHVTQFFPELIPQATDIVAGEEQLLEKFPKQMALIKELCQLKLDTLAEQMYMSRVRDRVERAKKTVIPELKAWAKDKSFGPYLNSQALLDTKNKKLRDAYTRNGREWLSKIINEYNEQMVPYANELSKKHGADYTDSEKTRGDALNKQLMRHNQLAMKLRSITN